jgi:hypothetical protein
MFAIQGQYTTERDTYKAAHLEPLREYSQWLCYRSEYLETRGKYTKKPVDPHTGGAGSSTNPATWATHKQAVLAASRYNLDGIGFALTADDPFTVIDLDACRDPETGEIEPWAWEIVQRLNSYTEISPSGTGVHIVLKAVLPVAGRRKGRIEAYYSGRYVTVTGDALAGYDVIHERADELAAWSAATLQLEHSLPAVSLHVVPPPTMADADILERASAARNGDKFRRLFLAGDTSGYPSQSEADQALLCMFTFYTRDPAQLQSLMRQSALYRADKDERYSTQDIPAALAFTAALGDAVSGVAVATGVSADEIAALRAEVAELKLQLAEERAARSALVYALRNPAVKTEVRTAIAATCLLEHKASLEPDGDGWQRVSLAAVGEQAGCSTKRASAHLDRLHELGVIEKKVEWSSRDVVDTETGEITTEGVKHMYLRTDRPQSKTLELLATLEPDPQRPTHGGRRVACPEHPEAGTVKRWALHCQECDRLLERGEEFHRAHPSVKMTVGPEELHQGDPYGQSDRSSIDTAAKGTRTVILTVGSDAPAVNSPDPTTPPTCYASLGCLQSTYCAAHGGCPFDPTPPTVLPSYRKENRQ